jgi:hypothetical protein
MHPTGSGVNTYIVRVWQPADDRERQLDLRGVVERIGDDTAIPFRSANELLALLQPRQRGIEPVEEKRTPAST